MPHRAEFCNTMDDLRPNLLHSQRCGSDTDVLLDGQTGIEEIGRLRHDSIGRPNRIHIAAVVRRIRNEVQSFTTEEPGCPRHMKGAGHDDGLLPALLTANFFRKAAFSAVFRLLSSIKIRLSGTPRDRSIRFSICDSLASPSRTVPPDKRMGRFLAFPKRRAVKIGWPPRFRLALHRRHQGHRHGSRLQVR